jgi:hypothetical protein
MRSHEILVGDYKTVIAMMTIIVQNTVEAIAATKIIGMQQIRTHLAVVQAEVQAMMDHMSQLEIRDQVCSLLWSEQYVR